MQQDTLMQLQQIAAFQRFSKGEYICHEGQPGDDMYVILKGSVGIYLTSALGTLTEVSQVRSGDFFGEMAIFDRLPRSASCIALEETICISINRQNLPQFLQRCPEIVERMLVNMSLRIRSLDEKIHSYKLSAGDSNQNLRFSIPAEYKSRLVPEPAQDPKYTQLFKIPCPICGGEVPITEFRRHALTVENIDLDARIHYKGCEPLWHEVVTCPHCFYSNHRLQFFKVNDANRERIRDILNEQYAVLLKARVLYNTPFDRQVLGHLQAVHLNQRVNAGDDTLLGMLWLQTYWLAQDAHDDTFAAYCAKQAVHHLSGAIEETQITDPHSKYSVALTLAYLLVYLRSLDRAKLYCAMALESPNEDIRKRAFVLSPKFE